MRRNDHLFGRDSLGTALLLGFFLSFVGLAAALAQQPESWASKMFSEMGTERAFNFGNLALHAEAEHRFAFKNIYKEDVEIISAQSNCSCTNVTVSKKVIKSLEVGEIIARVDTSGKVHTGARKVTVTVRFSKPRSAEIQLQVQSFIRSDVVFNPGNVEFGTVSQGHGVEKKVMLEYHGSNPNWRLSSIKKNNPALTAVAKPVAGNRSGKVYEVTVSLKEEADPGYINGTIQFIANDGDGQSIFVPVHALVLAPLMATPTQLQIGVLHPGETVSKNLVLHGSVPFRIERISSPDTRVSFLTANLESTLHVIPVTFQAGRSPVGEIKQPIHIVTSKKDLDPIDIMITGYVSNEQVLPKHNDLESAQNEQLLRAYAASNAPAQLALGLLSAPLGNSRSSDFRQVAMTPKDSVFPQNNANNTAADSAAADSTAGGDTHYTASRFPRSIATHITAGTIDENTYTASAGERSRAKKTIQSADEYQVARPVSKPEALDAEQVPDTSEKLDTQVALDERGETGVSEEIARTASTKLELTQADNNNAEPVETTDASAGTGETGNLDEFDEDGWTAANTSPSQTEAADSSQLEDGASEGTVVVLNDEETDSSSTENTSVPPTSKIFFRRPEQIPHGVSVPRASIQNPSGNTTVDTPSTPSSTTNGTVPTPADGPAIKSARGVRRTASRSEEVDPTTDDSFFILDVPL